MLDCTAGPSPSRPEATSPNRAAEYIRRSTEHQQYSTENQHAGCAQSSYLQARPEFPAVIVVKIVAVASSRYNKAQQAVLHAVETKAQHHRVSTGDPMCPSLERHFGWTYVLIFEEIDSYKIVYSTLRLRSKSAPL
jgi:hypothetical protein